MRRLVAVAVVLGLVLLACGGELTLTEYAAELEAGAAAMNGRLDELDAELSATNGLEAAKRYANERVVARYGFVDKLEGLDPPEVISDLHNAALGIMGRLADAESALADYVNSLESATGLDTVWSTPLGVAARSADEEAVELCLAAQAEFDRTEERTVFEGVLWIPPELKEIVTVAFGCIQEQR